MQMALDSVKINRIESKIALFRQSTKTNLKEVQRLGGLLSWASDMVDGGRTFTQRLWALTSGTQRAHDFLRITKSVHLDLDWWEEFLPDFNGKAQPLPFLNRRPAVQMATDATGEGDIGIWWDGAFVRLDEQATRILCPEIPPGAQHVQTWEAAAPLCALRLFCTFLQKREIWCLTDNTGAEAGFGKGASRHEGTQCILRAAFWETRKLDCRLILHWIPGKANPLADTVSRLHEPGQPIRLARLIKAEHQQGRLAGERPTLGWVKSLKPDLLRAPEPRYPSQAS
jgi:hypothetical protein